MNIICVKKCGNPKYIPGKLYSYEEYDYIDGLEIKHYAIYDMSKIYTGDVYECVGYSNIGVINNNFARIYEYNQELQFITDLFNFYMGFKFKNEE